MTNTAKALAYPTLPLRSKIAAQSASLSAKLQEHQSNIFPPHARKSIRSFSPSEAAKLLGVAEGYLRTSAVELERRAAEGAEAEFSPELAGGRRMYSVQDISAMRAYLDKPARSTGRYLPHRRNGEELQVISIMNFKGGSGKTTTSAHLAQYLALRGYRVLSTWTRRQAFRRFSGISRNLTLVRMKRSMVRFDTMRSAARFRRSFAGLISRISISSRATSN
jgi:chromosome partitioning protein